ncbi:hypothetical protein ACN47E_009941 [Coniothyrium glycines]
MRVNFDQCAKKFANDTAEGAALRARWGWHGPLVGLPYNATTQISKEGCLALCGPGTAYYPWKDVSSTLTTWILPVIGTLLQAPFESNATKRTFLAITRWVGSPIASLSYVLWNIKVSAKAALMVDMAVKYDETPDRQSHFGSMRDSMYLLLVMNQYTIRPQAMLREKEAEGLLRIVLFSKDLVLTGTDKSLRRMRRILAREVREMRRRGAVPVFVSTMWFLFAFALSISDAFGNLGANTTAHDLALGCLLAWFPVLIMGSIVDRNPIATEAIRKKLNGLVDHVRLALRDKAHRAKFIETFQGQPDFAQLRMRVDDIVDKEEYMSDFFVDFAGQARVRWHYGAAHPILSDIENCYIAKKGRNWLANESEARSSLVLGPSNDDGLVWFDIREFWQVLSAICVVAGSCGGAFVLSYFTPTVGLGCRSGGYTIFFATSLGLLVAEMTVWLILSPHVVDAPLMRRTATRLHSNATFNRLEDDAHGMWTTLKNRAASFRDASEAFCVHIAVRVALFMPWQDKNRVQRHVERYLERVFTNLKAMSPQRKWELFFFRPVEIFNTIWLVYIVLAQTFGWYKTCACVTSTWGGGGGYLDFGVQDTSNSKWVLYYWTAGTLMTAFVMTLSMFYITVEWCQQSFLSTENYEHAMAGLMRTRKYRHLTYFLRWSCRTVLSGTLDQLERFAKAIGLIKKRQTTLLWTRNHSHEWSPSTPSDTSTGAHHHHQASPSIELTDYSMIQTAAKNEGQPYDTPGLAPNSLFPLPHAIQRPRQESEASLPPGESQSYYRISDDSSRALIQTPPEAHRLSDRERQRRMSGEGRVSFEDTPFLMTPPEQGARPGGLLSLETTVHSRQGYRRSNSESGLPPADLAGVSQNGLGIHVDERDLEKGS